MTINAGGPFTLTIAGGVGTGIDVQAGAGLVTVNADLTFGGASDTIKVDNAAGAIVNGTIDGPNGLIKAGAGKLTLTGANIYMGGTTINGGTLAISSDGNLGNTAGGITFDNNATLQTLAGIMFAGTRAVTVNPLGGKIDVFGQNSTLNGQVSGAGVLTVTDSVAGLGTLTLTADNSGLTGGLSVDGQATVAVSADNNLGDPLAPLSLANNGTLQTTATFSSGRPVNLPARSATSTWTQW